LSLYSYAIWGQFKGDSMARKELLKAIGKKAVEGYAAAKKAIGGIRKQSDLEKLANQIAKQSKKAQEPGKLLRGRKPGVKKAGNAARFVERRKQLKGASKSKPIGGKRN
jgi:hypothetical protein